MNHCMSGLTGKFGWGDVGVMMVSVANENEKLKKEAQNFESERLRMSQSMQLPSMMFQNKQEHKKFLNMKFITGMICSLQTMGNW